MEDSATILARRVLASNAPDLVSAVADALRSYGDERARAERQRLETIVRSVRYDDAAIRARENGDELYAETGFEQAQEFILAAFGCCRPSAR